MECQKYATSFCCLLILAASLYGQTNSPQLDTLVAKFKPPIEAKKIQIFDVRKSSEPLITRDVERGPDQSLSETWLESIRAAVVNIGITQRPFLIYRWVDDKGAGVGAAEGRPFKFEGEIDSDVTPPPPDETGISGRSGASDASGPTSFSIEEKNKACSDIQEQVFRQAKGFNAAHYTILIFDENLSLFYQNRPYGVVGDLIFVAVIRPSNMMSPSVEYSPCSLEPEMPSLYIGDTSALGTLQSGRNEAKPVIFPPRRCFNTTVNIKITAKLGPGTDAPSIQGSCPLSQYNRYVGTLQIGVLFTPQHQVGFGLRTVDTQNIIYNKGPVDKGPEYTASLVVYSVFHHLENMFSAKKHYSGRDIVNDRSFMDSIGAVIGVGLAHPGDRFIVGLSYEVLYGINLVGVVEFAKLNKLGDGLSEGDPYSGTETSIPIRSYWGTELVLGLSLDLRYVTALFSKK